MSQENKAAVPKFTSFKPKAAVEPEVRESREEPIARNESRNDYEKHRHGGRDRHHRHREHRERDDRKRPEDRERRPPSPTVAKDEFEESDLFIIDRRGDQNNVEYGSLHRYSVPAYHRTGNGYVLGASARIDRQESTDKAIVLRLRDDARDGKSRRPLLDRDARLLDGARTLKVRASEPLQDHSFSHEADYIELRSSKSLIRKRASESPGRTVAEVDYRSIEGEAKGSSTPVDEDFEFAAESDMDDAEESRSLELRQKNAELVRRTKEQPQNIDAWVQLLHFQAKLDDTNGETETLTPPTRRTLADVRLSIYGKALKHMPNDTPGRDRLILGMLEEGAFVWESSVLAAKWKEVLQNDQKSTLLWSRYLNFMQTNAASFSFTTCKEEYVKCLRILSSTTASGDREPDLPRVYIFLRLICFVRDAGYHELALAMWQVVLEYHYLRPPQLACEKSEEFEALESWWETDVPRIGEECAKGWDYFYENGINGPGMRTTKADFSAVDNDLTLVNAVKREAELSKKLHLPSAVDDDEDIDDPYRQVMFSDVRDIAECMAGEVPRRALVDAFLSFAGLPPAHKSEHPGVYEWTDDTFVRTQHIRSSQGDGVHALRNQQWTDFDLFFRNPFPDVKILGLDKSAFVERVLCTLVERDIDDDDLAVYYLAYKVHVLPNEAKKAAKRLLKTRPSSMPLYNAYALMEAKLGNVGKAIDVWKTALGGGIDHSDGSVYSSVLLWHSWVLTSLEKGPEDGALGVLLGMTKGSTTMAANPRSAQSLNAAHRLKSLRTFSEIIDSLLSNVSLTLAVSAITCLGWFGYLMEGYALESGLQVFQKYANNLRKAATAGVAALELLHQAKAALIDHHIQQRRPYKPAMVRVELNKSLSPFPENTVLLNVFSGVRGHHQIDDRLRDTATINPVLDIDRKGLVAVHHRITMELQRWHNSSATANSARRLFTSALLDQESTTRHSSLLWKMWCDFECQTFTSSQVNGSTAVLGGRNRQEAASRLLQVFYHGMRYLPWHKDWIVTGLNKLCERRVIDEEEVAKVVEVMEERELRIMTQALLSN